MTATQKYLFDLQGYLLIDDVLTDQQCETAKRKITERMQPLEKTPDSYDANSTLAPLCGPGRSGRAVHLADRSPQADGGAHRDHRAQAAPGERLQLRALQGCPRFEMHGGRVNFRYTVQGDQIFTGLTVVSFALQDGTS